MKTINIDDFVEYKGYRKRSEKGKPTVTIQKLGTLSLNEVAFKALGSPRYVSLMKHKHLPIIAIKPADELSLSSVAIKQTSNISRSYIIANRTFPYDNDIDTAEAKRYEASIQEGVLLVDLEQWVVVSKQKRKKEMEL